MWGISYEDNPVIIYEYVGFNMIDKFFFEHIYFLYGVFQVTC